MNISAIFIRRPVATLLIMVFILAAGIAAFTRLPVASLPTVDLPTIRIQANLPGASPETMASSVATPLELRLGQIAGVTELTSRSSLGRTQIIIQFALSKSIDSAARDVEAAINAAIPTLPADMPNPPSYTKMNPNMIPVMILALQSETIAAAELYDLADSIIAARLSKLDGVAEVTINGADKSAIRIQADSAKLAAMGLSLEQIRRTVQASNFLAPMGTISDDQRSQTLSANSQVFAAADLSPIPINRTTKLSDVATVIDGVSNQRLAGFIGNKKAVLIMITRAPGANLITISDRIKDEIPMLQNWLPAGSQLTILSDRSGGIRSSISHVESTLGLAVLLVVLTMFLFLRRWSITLIPALTMPVAICGTFAVMFLLDYSLDNLSLMALTVATGFVVDDAIVMVENIHRRHQLGESPMEAALHGSREVSFTIISMTLSLIAVFIPILFMPGMAGKFFRAFGVTLSIAILFSAIVSLTLSPMMAARLVGRANAKSPHPFWQRIEQGLERKFNAMTSAYLWLLDWVLGWRRLAGWVTFALAILTIYLYVVVPKGLVPTQDSLVINGVTEAASDSSFTAMVERQNQISAILERDSAVENFSSFVGQNGSNSGQIYINLKPPNQREPSDQVIKRLNRQFAAVPGIRVYLSPVSDFKRGGRGSKSQFQYSLLSDNQTDLEAASKMVLERLKTIPIITDVTRDTDSGGLQLALAIDRDAANLLGVKLQAIDDALYDAFGQRQVSTSFTARNNYQIILEIRPEQQSDPSQLLQLRIPNQEGQLVPLAAVASLRPATAPLVITHQGTDQANTISFAPLPGVAMGTAVATINSAVAELTLPPTVRGEFAGEAKAFAQDNSSQLIALLAAILVVYFVLGILYESFLQPLTIISTIPSAGLGALLALLITGVDFSLFAMIGVVLLVGIVKKNAIMMVDFALVEQRAGASPREAIIAACRVRFRPIMMTSLAAFMGALPLALDGGPGSELRQTLGITLVGGLLVSQCLTLFSTPVVYLGLENLKRRRGDKLTYDRLSIF
ncbi:MAG: efflux RND transporter permease subunit [Candidatus Pacebacteria bacterium]|nr:efflux RND transporter permease subunit [Candidatus Paceibacterota bacterium]